MARSPFNEHELRCFIVRIYFVAANLLIIPICYYFYYRHKYHCDRGSKLYIN